MAVESDIRVLIADDHAPTRAVVRRALEADGIIVCAEVPDANGAIEMARETLPDVAILDIRMPGNGILAAQEIRNELPQVIVVMLTVSTNDADLFSALAAGASGYWLKGQDPKLLSEMVRRVLAGEVVLAGILVERLVTEWRSQNVRKRARDYLPNGNRLTARECEVIELLSEGLTTAEIAGRLFIAEVTVRTHIANMLRKMNVADRRSALSQFQRPRWLANPDQTNR